MGNFPNHGVKANPLTIWHSLVSTNKVQVLGEFVWVLYLPDQRFSGQITVNFILSVHS